VGTEELLDEPDGVDDALVVDELLETAENVGEPLAVDDDELLADDDDEAVVEGTGDVVGLWVLEPLAELSEEAEAVDETVALPVLPAEPVCKDVPEDDPVLRAESDGAAEELPSSTSRRRRGGGSDRRRRRLAACGGHARGGGRRPSA
jgi:hypothetical protein